MSLFIDIAATALVMTAPSGTVLNGNVYSDTANFGITANPAWDGTTASTSAFPDTAAKYLVTNLGTLQVFRRDTRYNIPYTDISVAADAIRRMGAPGIIEIDELDIRGSLSIGNGETNDTDVAWWGPISGPFTPITGVTIRARNPQLKPRIHGVSRSAFLKNNVGQTFSVPGQEITFDHVTLHHVTGSKYIFEDILGVNSPHINGRATFWNVDFTGNEDWGGGYDTKSAIRGAYAQWDLQDCTFPKCEEHCIYDDAPQGFARLLRCYNTSNSGPGDAKLGRTFHQFVQRVELGDPNGPLTPPDPYYGGPAGHGVILVEDCIARNSGNGEPSSAYTVAAFLGTYINRRCSAPDTKGGMMVVWTPGGGGMHTTVGSFETAPWPLSRTAFSTLEVLIEDFTGDTTLPHLNPTSAIAISGARRVVIGPFSVQTPNVAISLWPWGNPNDPDGIGGRLDNGTVEFNVGANPASYAGFTGAGSKVRYGFQNNPLQTGLGSARLSDAQINALAGPNTAYPPWNQPLDGSLFLDPTTFDDLVVLDHQVDLIASSGTHIFTDPATFTITHPAGTVDAPFNADLSPATLTLVVPDHTVDVQASPIDVFIDPVTFTVETPAHTLDVPVNVDLSVVALTVETPDGTVDLHSSRITNVLFKAFAVTVTTPDHTVDAPRTIDIDPVHTPVDTPDMLVTSPVAIDISFTQMLITVPEHTITFGQGIDTEPATFDFATPDATVDMHEPFLAFSSPPMVWRLPYRTSDGAKRYLSLTEELEAVAYDQAGVARTRGGPLYVTALRQNGERVALNYEAVGWSMQITSLARVKAHIGGITTSQHDALLTSLIDSLSSRVEQYLWRTIAKQSYTEQHELRRGDKVITLRASPIVSVQSLKVVSHPDNFTDAAAYSSTSWSIDNNLALIRLLFETPAKVAYVQVVYLAGMATDTTDFVARYPDIAQQCDAQIAYEFSRRNTPGGNTSFGAGGTAFTSDVAFLPEFKRTLDGHRRVVH